MMQKGIWQGSAIPKNPRFILNLEMMKVYGMGFRVKFAYLLLLLLVLSLLFAGCISFGPPPPATPRKPDEGGLTSVPTGEGGIQDITARNAPKVSLGDAVDAITAAGQDGTADTAGMTITKIWGYGVDSSGLGRTWVLGMQGGGRTTLLSFNEGEVKELDLPTALPPGEVKVGELLSPQDLYRKNMNTIVLEMNRLRVGESDLSLDEDSYEVIIHSASESSTLSFSAKTGELIPSP